MESEGKRLLIVDDQLGIRVLLHEVFKKEGYSIFLAENGQVALNIMVEKSPSVVLLDMKIPGMDGIEILRQIRKIAPATKVIMMTAYGELDMLNEASELGVLRHFTKPFDIDELTMEVNKQMAG